MDKNNILPKLLNINRMWFNIVVITLSLFSVIIYYNVSKAKDAATTIPITKPPDIKIVLKYPHCTKNDVYSLQLLINKYIFDVSVCNTTTPLDLQESTTIKTTTTTTTNINSDNCPKTNSPTSTTTTTQKLTSKETRDTIIVYVAIALLLASLFAALLEAWKAFINTKKEQAKTPTNTMPSNVHVLASVSGINGGVNVPTKPELTRRCSLADLTVLRHHRRESMMRRDSAMHMSIDGGVPPGAGNSHRVPLKTMGASKSQDDGRRNSISFQANQKWKRSFSEDKPDDLQTHHRIHMIRHH